MDLFSDIQENKLYFLPKINGYHAKWNEIFKGFDIKVPNGKLFYCEQFFNKKISNRSIEYFLENDLFCNHKTTNWRNVSTKQFLNIKFKNIKWKQDKIKIYNKTIPLPRYTSWYGDIGKHYTYSGIKYSPNKWNKGLLYIKNQIEKVVKITFNSVLINWYRDGEDYLNWHSDNEGKLGKNPVIASVNFGETRDFLIRKLDKSTTIKIPLKHGTLLIMHGELQDYWQHSIPKRKKIKKSRVNLTFRVIN